MMSCPINQNLTINLCFRTSPCTFSLTVPSPSAVVSVYSSPPVAAVDASVVVAVVVSAVVDSALQGDNMTGVREGGRGRERGKGHHVLYEIIITLYWLNFHQWKQLAKSVKKKISPPVKIFRYTVYQCLTNQYSICVH